MAHVMRVLNHTGDTETTWKPTDQKSVEEVREEFDTLVKKGWMGVKTGQPHDEQIKKFDPQAEEIIMRPPMAGG